MKPRTIFIGGDLFEEVPPAEDEREARKFVWGPIPLEPLQKAAALGATALVIWLAVWHRTHWRRNTLATLTKAVIQEWGVCQQARIRAVKQLVEADLIYSVAGRSGEATLYGIGPAPKKVKKSGQKGHRLEVVK